MSTIIIDSDGYADDWKVVDVSREEDRVLANNAGMEAEMLAHPERYPRIAPMTTNQRTTFNVAYAAIVFIIVAGSIALSLI